MEQRDLIRWFKKGWAYIIVGAVVNWFVTAIMGVTSFQVLVDMITTNPTGAITGIIALGILTLLYALAIFPIFSGWLIEEIDRRIRK